MEEEKERVRERKGGRKRGKRQKLPQDSIPSTLYSIIFLNSHTHNYSALSFLFNYMTPPIPKVSQVKNLVTNLKSLFTRPFSTRVTRTCTFYLLSSLELLVPFQLTGQQKHGKVYILSQLHYGNNLFTSLPFQPESLLRNYSCWSF